MRRNPAVPMEPARVEKSDTPVPVVPPSVEQKAGGRDTMEDNAHDVVSRMCSQVANEQGGTEVMPISDNGKGNSGDLPNECERANSDPQGFTYHDYPRSDVDGG